MAKYCAIVGAILLCMIAFAPHAESITCDKVLQSLAPCRASMNHGGSVTESCCSGVRSVNSATKTTPERRNACECIKRAAKSYKLNTQTASSVLKKCNVNLGYSISSSLDCTK
ncbi:hypothetical protein C2S52_007686 [Perilla frutescens var. hirtella]|nr:hypothetical protein C2S51_008202 [Perilla frutescens var. frutescens]KAH6788134.1 hypothetical protein C2S52_007686 [Perilla frutescens var. hirtella]